MRQDGSSLGIRTVCAYVFECLESHWHHTIILEDRENCENNLITNCLDGKLYAMGDRQTGSDSPKANLNDNEMYNPLNDSWTVMEQMPTKRSGIAAAASPVDGNIYVFGGENPFKYEGPVKTFDIVERYNPKTNTWTIEQPMPTARNGLAATSYDNKIYVIVGGNKPGLFVGNVNKVLSLNSSNAIE